MKRLHLINEFLITLAFIFLSLILQLFNFEQFKNGFSLIFLITVFLIFGFWIVRVRFLYKFWTEVSKEELVKETDRLHVEESTKLILTLQAQRHDFRNQLQVIKVMAQFKKSEEIVKYIQDCSSALDLSNTVVTQIENPIISATLLVFATRAKEKGVNFHVDSDVNFSGFNLSAAQTSRILVNILQNALEALETINNAERTIQVTLWESADNYNFLIWNNGPVIPETLLERIFQPGFSTKESTGLGLVIVKELVGEIGGAVNVKSSAGFGTEFKITLPNCEKRLKLKKVDYSPT